MDPVNALAKLLKLETNVKQGLAAGGVFKRYFLGGGGGMPLASAVHIDWLQPSIRVLTSLQMADGISSAAERGF